MFTNNNIAVPIIFWVIGMLMGVPTLGQDQIAARVIADYASYTTTDFLHVSSGTVKAKQLGEKGWHVAIELPSAESRRRVTLTADKWDFMRLLPLRAGAGRLARAGNTIEAPCPAEVQAVEVNDLAVCPVRNNRR